MLSVTFLMDAVQDTVLWRISELMAGKWLRVPIINPQKFMVDWFVHMNTLAHVHTHSATFPDQPVKILPAVSSKTLLVSVLRNMGRKFEVYLEGSRVPLELSVNTSVLARQRVDVKYLG